MEPFRNNQGATREMQINLNQLRCFYLAARHKSISKAAEILFVTPPAITMQIKKLEEWLGFKLLVRRGNTIALAKDMEDIYLQAERIFGEVERFETQLDQLVRKSSKEIRIGSHYIPAKYIMPRLINKIQQFNPQLNLKVVLDSVPHLPERLRSHELHFALTGSPRTYPKIKTIPLFEEELVLISLSESKHVQKTAISIKEIQNIPLLMTETDTAPFEVINDYLQSNGITPCIAMDNISGDIIKNFLLQDVGAAFLLRFSVQNKLDSGEFQEIRIKEGVPILVFKLAFLDQKQPGTEISSLVSSLARMKLKRSDLIA